MVNKVSNALAEWGYKVASSFLPAYRIPEGSAIGNIMQGFFGMNPASYNVWKELGFLAEPLLQSLVTPAVNRMLAGMSDEQAQDVVFKFVDAFITQAKEKGSVNLFGIELKEDAFIGLREILANKMGV
jgi:hypothetical protein